MGNLTNFWEKTKEAIRTFHLTTQGWSDSVILFISPSDPFIPFNHRIDQLKSENRKLKEALAGLIPWAGNLPDGPHWATSDAKKRNRAMFEEAFQAATECFPPDFNGFVED